jgi:hypothetical protein
MLRTRYFLAVLTIAISAMIARLLVAQAPPKVDWGVVRLGETSVQLEVADAAVFKEGVIRLPRLNNPIGNVYRQGDAAKSPLKFAPLVSEWLITLPAESRSGKQTVIVETVGKPHLAGEPRVIAPAENGVITLPAHDAVTHGENLRYEPQPHKNTVGYWSRKDDWCQWHFSAKRAGTYEVWLLQGCGQGQGGSEVALRIGEHEIKFTVEETGHFQNFKNRRMGPVKLDKPGQFTLELRPQTKAAAAVMDVREVRLIPVDP